MDTSFERRRPRVCGFGKPSLLLLFPCLIPICCCFRNYFLIQLNTIYSKDHPTFIINQHPLMLGFTSVFSDILLGGIFYSIITIRQRRFNKTMPFTGRGTTQGFNMIEGEQISLFQDYRCILILLSNSILECIFLTSFIALGNDYENSYRCYQMNIVLILVECILLRFVLKYSIYRHKRLAICLILLGMIGIGIEKAKILFSHLSVIYIFFVYFFIGLLDIGQKYLMDEKYIHPYKLLLIQGCISSTMFIFIFSFLWAVPCHWSNYCNDKGGFENIFTSYRLLFTSEIKGIIYYFAYMITCGFYVLSVFSTIGFFVPTLRCMCDVLGTFVYWLLTIITDENEHFTWVTFIMNIVIIIGFLIYNEILILYCFDLGENTSREIQKRSIEDEESAQLAPGDESLYTIVVSGV